MNPTGLRLEEKKSADEVRSVTSYKSTHSTRSSVLERAREYNRRIDEQNAFRGRRSKSMERPPSDAGGSAVQVSTPRSKSASRVPQSAPPKQNQRMTRERAMQSVRRESPVGSSSQHRSTPNGSHNNMLFDDNGFPTTTSSAQQPKTTRTPTQNPAPARRAVASPSSNPFHQQHDASSARRSTSSRGNSSSRTPATANSRSQQQQQQQPHNNRSNKLAASPGGRSSSANKSKSHGDNPDAAAVAVVTPELLVDALSGHEDGLLAIAEKLMERYDAGYDVMGEAIIDAFADVQKLFQHVVEAAHMEGAAFEASRRDSEQQQAAAAGGGAGTPHDPVVLMNSPSHDNNNNPTSPAGSASAQHHRHDEFIDQDVKDVLVEAIRKGTALRDAARHEECYELFEQACQAASSLLPVDSDHRGRLQLSIARAESMSPDRANAILRYAMDDVLRSGLRAGRTPLPDPSKRADVVLSRPTPKGGSSVGGTVPNTPAGIMGVVQSSDEALASLMEEMKEILSAPVYKDTPLQDVARRFWAALSEATKSQTKKEERLEQNLAQLKGEFLLARAEWEEKLTQANETADSYKDKYRNLKESIKNDGYLDQARSFASRLNDASADSGDVTNHHDSVFGSVKSHASKAGSVASLGSGLAQHARTIVTSMNNNFNCSNLNERNGPVVNSELEQTRSHSSSRGRSSTRRQQQQGVVPSSSSSVRSGTSGGRSRSRSKASRSFREYSHSPQRVDV